MMILCKELAKIRWKWKWLRKNMPTFDSNFAKTKYKAFELMFTDARVFLQYVYEVSCDVEVSSFI